jgi:hypothetical protein
MRDCIHIKDSQELIGYLRTQGRSEAFDFDYQLKTNYGFVYKLANGKVIFIPHNFQGEGFLFEDRKCFDQIIEADKFPIDNPEKNLYDTEINRIRTINKQIDFYRNHLNSVLKFDFPEINQDVAGAYLKKVIGRTLKKLTTHTDLVGLIAVFGEIIRKGIGGKWVIEKWYGTYNPYFKPRILTPDRKLIFIDDKILGKVKWKVSNINTIFKTEEGILDLESSSKYHECKILEENIQESTDEAEANYSNFDY